MQSELNPLELMNILDVLKNHELYQERLKGIQEATQALNDGKFVKATVEQANSLMEAAKIAVETAEKENEEKKDLLRKETRELEVKREKINSDLQQRSKELADKEADLAKLRGQFQTELETFKQERLTLHELRRKLSDEYMEVAARREDYVKRINEIEQIINRPFVATNKEI